MELTEYIKNCKTVLVPLVMLLIIVRIIVLVMTPDGSAMYFIRQIICTLGWFGVAYFMFNCSLDLRPGRYNKQEITHMKHVAFWATIACVARLVSTVVYYWPLLVNNMVMTAHNFIEVITWTLLAAFFGLYWRARAVEKNFSDDI